MEYVNENITMTDDELMHWGIKGMKWGVRRFQNKDGSLTPAGEKRRAKLEAKIEKLGGKKSGGSSEDKADAPRKKSASDMSDDELAKAINRARMEDAYRQLRPEPVKESFAKKFVNDAVKPAMINSGRKFLENGISKLAENLLKEKVDPNSLESLKKTYEKLDYKQKIDKMINPDKYLSEEDKNKRQQRDFDAETREAQREGYTSVQDKAVKTRAAEEAAAKVASKTNVTNRVTNIVGKNIDASDKDIRKTTRTGMSGDEYDFNDTATSGQSYVSNSTTLSLPAPTKSNPTVSSGESYVRSINWRDMDWGDD